MILKTQDVGEINSVVVLICTKPMMQEKLKHDAREPRPWTIRHSRMDRREVTVNMRTRYNTPVDAELTGTSTICFITILIKLRFDKKKVMTLTIQDLQKGWGMEKVIKMKFFNINLDKHFFWGKRSDIEACGTNPSPFKIADQTDWKLRKWFT